MTYVLPTHVDVFDITDIPELCSKLSIPLKLIVAKQNYEVIMTVVELYDNVVGHEPETDFTKDKVTGGMLLLQFEKKYAGGSDTINPKKRDTMDPEKTSQHEHNQHRGCEFLLHKLLFS